MKHWTDDYTDEELVKDPRLNNPRFYSAAPIMIYWHWFWFKWVFNDLGSDRKHWAWYINVRLANARSIYLGPIHIIIPRPWLPGPARDKLRQFSDPPGKI